MAIYKAVVSSEYVQIPNSTMQDNSISFEARGLLGMLLSMPVHWEVHKSWVASQSKAGKDKVNSIFKELEDSGYIRKEETQRKFGKFASNDYFIFPTKCTSADLPLRLDRSGSTVNGESATRKETVKENKHIENKHKEISPTAQVNQKEIDLNTVFEFWKETMGKNARTTLSKDRASKIKARLREGYSVDEIKLAITNCSTDPWYVEKKVNDIEYICRNQQHLDKFLEASQQTTSQQVALSGQPLVSSQGKSFDQLMGEVIK